MMNKGKFQRSFEVQNDILLATLLAVMSSEKEALPHWAEKREGVSAKGEAREQTFVQPQNLERCARSRADME